MRGPNYAQSNHLVTGDFSRQGTSFSAWPLEAPGCSAEAAEQEKEAGVSHSDTLLKRVISGAPGLNGIADQQEHGDNYR